MVQHIWCFIALVLLSCQLCLLQIAQERLTPGKPHLLLIEHRNQDKTTHRLRVQVTDNSTSPSQPRSMLTWPGQRNKKAAGNKTYATWHVMIVLWTMKWRLCVGAAQYSLKLLTVLLSITSTTTEFLLWGVIPNSVYGTAPEGSPLVSATLPHICYGGGVGLSEVQ